MHFRQVISLTAIVLANLFTIVRAQGLDSMVLGDLPRSKQSYDKPGHYEMVAFLDKNEIDPGDTVNISFYFSGYGLISLSKIYFKSNKDIFQDTGCYVSGGLSGNINLRHFYWTAIKDKINAYTGGVITMVGIGKKNSPVWGSSTPYLDLVTDANSTSILTEFPIDEHPPYYIHLITKKNIEDGPYSVMVVYTYFNGKEWAGQQQQMSFKVKNVIERNPGWAWLIGVVGVFIAFIGIVPIIGELGKKVVSLVFRHTTEVVPPSSSSPRSSQRTTPPTKSTNSNVSKKKDRKKSG